MRAVILAGGLGTRISEESIFKPKPMIEIGGMPILWHIMKTFYHYGIDDFVICAGYKQHKIKEYFSEYFIRNSDVTFDFKEGESVVVHKSSAERWKVTVVDTGLHTMTGGRVKRVREYIGGSPFLLTYGDGVADINIADLISFHQNHKQMVTISAYNAGQRFGVIDVEQDGRVREFREKSKGDGNLINIGYMVCEPEFLDFIEDDNSILEKQPLQTIAEMGQLAAYKHSGFWQCMDTMREKELLEELISKNKAPWMVWERNNA